MLGALFGNKTIGKVMLFLLVNERGYPTQIHRQLKIPLTPVQQALNRLEKGQILMSSLEGKTRFFHYNDQCPFRHELELLLKKYYSLLSVHEKKLFFLNKVQGPSQKSSTPGKFVREQLLKEIWEKLKSIRYVFFSAKTKNQAGANIKGKGDVKVLMEEEGTIIFKEQGRWRNQQGKECDFSNSYRWKWNREAQAISLEHLRMGLERPVFLLDLIPTSENELESLHSHLCQEDTYVGRILCDPDFIQLSWRVFGPKKNDEIVCLYT